MINKAYLIFILIGFSLFGFSSYAAELGASSESDLEAKARMQRLASESQKPSIPSKWTKMKESSEIDFYVDLGESYRAIDIIYFPTLHNQKNADSKKSKSETGTINIDCKNNLWSIADVMSWSENMGRGVSSKIDLRQTPWTSIDYNNPNDVFETLRRDFCKIKVFGERPALIDNRSWAPMIGNGYAEQITRLFVSHIIVKESIATGSFVDVAISIDDRGLIANFLIVNRSGDLAWEYAVIKAIEGISQKYQIRSPNGYGNHGKIQARFKP